MSLSDRERITNIIKRMEPDIDDGDGNIALLSIAISLKRIADSRDLLMIGVAPPPVGTQTPNARSSRT